MRILGIDPGIAIVGFGLIEADRGACGYSASIRASPSWALA